MFETKLILFYVVVILGIGFVAVKFYFYSKFKRNTQLSEFDKSLWNFKFVSIYFAAMVFAFLIFLPITGDYSKIRPETSSQELVLQQLVENQQEIGEDLDQLGRVGFLVFIFAGFYFVSLIDFLGKLQIERKRNDPQFKKPLGL